MMMMGCEPRHNKCREFLRPVFRLAGRKIAEVHSRREESQQELKAYFSALLSHHGAIWVDLFGWSMFPQLMPGNRVRIVAAQKPLQIGQVVLLIFGNKAVAHRLVAWDEDKSCWVLKGDSLHRFDPPEFEEDLIGVVDSMRKNGRITPVSSDPQLAYLSYRLCRIWEDKMWFFPAMFQRVSYLLTYALCLAWLRWSNSIMPKPSR